MFLTTRPFRTDLFSELSEVQKVFNEVNSKAKEKYPPTDIYSFNGDTYLEIALAGFKETDINIEYKDDVIRVTGETKKDVSNREYSLKNIAQRAFTREFVLTKDAEDIQAAMNDGILQIKIVHKKDQPKKIEVKIGTLNSISHQNDLEKEEKFNIFENE